MKNIQTEEQLFALAEQVHEFLKDKVSSDDIQATINRGNDIASWMANTGKALADAKYWQDRAKSLSILTRIKDSKAIQLPASVLNELIKSETKDINYLVNWLEQLDKETKYQLEWTRSVVSAAKEEMKLSNYQNG